MEYLVYHINERLSIVPTKALDHLNFARVGEDDSDQGDLLVRSERRIHQAFPRRVLAVRERDQNGARVVPT